MSDHPAKKMAQSFDPVRAHFNNRMNDLKEKYDHKKFTDAVCNIIWEEFKAESVETIDKVVNELLVNSKWAPTLVEFQTAKAKLREGKWNEEKKQSAREAKNFFSDERVGVFFKNFAELVFLPKEEREAKLSAFLAGFESTRKKSPGAFTGCNLCGSAGVVYKMIPSELFQNTINEYAYSCSCKHGDEYPNFPKWRG